MQLTKVEVCQLKELLLSCTNTITCMSLFLNEVQDQELKAILTKQFPLHIDDYNMKAEFLKEEMGPNGQLQVPEQISIDLNLGEKTSVQPVLPNTNVTKLNDREIATNYLLTLKRAGKEYAWAAMEASQPKLRQFLKDAFTMACNHAYEVWDWMAKHQYYGICPEPKVDLNEAASIFEIIPTDTMTS